MSKLFHMFMLTGLVILFAYPNLAQSEFTDLPHSVGWRKFQLNQTTNLDVEIVFGKAKKKQTKRSKQTLPNGWTKYDKGKNVQTLSYKELGGYDSVEFAFVEDKLVGISFLLKQNKMKGLLNYISKLLPASKLSEVYKSDFLLFFGIPENSAIADYEGQKETTIPKVYQQKYSLISINKESIILVEVDNTNIKSGIKVIFGKPTAELFPGFVQRIHIYSRQ